MPQRAVMIHLGEAQVLERQVAHAIERGIDVHGARFAPASSRLRS